MRDLIILIFVAAFLAGVVYFVPVYCVSRTQINFGVTQTTGLKCKTVWQYVQEKGWIK